MEALPPLPDIPPEAEGDPPAPVTPPVAMLPPLPVIPPPDKPPSKACRPRGFEEQAKTKGMRRVSRFIFCLFPAKASKAYAGYDNANRLDTCRECSWTQVRALAHMGRAALA